MPNRIVFSADGSTLFHSARSGMVVLWNIAAAQVVARCQGYLIGIARDGHTFLTMSGAETFAWDMQTGSSVALNVVDPDQYARYQRTIIRPASRGQLTVELIDGFDREPSRSLRINYTTPTRQAYFECIEFLPTNHHLLAVIYGEEAGHSWARGVCVDSTSGHVTYSFPVNSFLTSPPFNVSIQHGVFAMSSRQRCFAVYDYRSGRALREVWLPTIGGGAIAIHPSSPWLVAVNQHTARFRDQILFLNIEQLTPNGATMMVGKIEREIAESGEVAEMVFHPPGDHLASLLTSEEIHLWNVETGMLVGSLPPNLMAGSAS